MDGVLSRVSQIVYLSNQILLESKPTKFSK